MVAKWYICNLGKDQHIQRLYYAVNEAGREAVVLSLKEMYEMTETPSDERACVVTSGSIWLNTHLRENRPNWIGNWHDESLYLCQRYYAYFGKYITQQNYVMMPLAEVVRQRKSLYDKLGVERQLFIRPDSGMKEFTGEIVCEERFDSFQQMAYDNPKVTRDLLCVVSSPVKIKKEVRLVIRRGKVVAGSTYRIAGHIISEPLEEQPESVEIIAFAEKVLADNPPPLPPIHVLDVAVHEDRLSVMEVGCFCCAGMYEIDRRKLVTAVSEAAEEEYATFCANAESAKAEGTVGPS